MDKNILTSNDIIAGNGSLKNIQERRKEEKGWKYSFFKNILKHINLLLSGLYWTTKKFRSEEYEGVLLASAFCNASKINFEQKLVYPFELIRR